MPAAVYADQMCAKDALSVLHNNVSFATDEILFSDNTGGCATLTNTYASDQLLETEYASTNVAGNVNLQATCSGDTGCIAVAACATPTGCVSAVIANWDSTTNGRSNLYNGSTAGGWQLTTTTPCAVAESSYAGSPRFNADPLGTTWPGMPSMGAEEYTGTCAN
jgi:hypothetical protein